MLSFKSCPSGVVVVGQIRQLRARIVELIASPTIGVLLPIPVKAVKTLGTLSFATMLLMLS